MVFNKIDNIPEDRQPLVLHDFYEVDGVPLPRIFLSAQSGQGVALLRQMLAEQVVKISAEDAPITDPRFDLDNSGENSDEFA